MKSGLRRLLSQAQQQTPVPLTTSNARRGLMFDLGTGKASKYNQLQQYSRSGTVYSIVSLLSQSAAMPKWKLYKKQPQDARRRYTTGDQGSDQRVEVIQHAALQLWHHPNSFHTNFEFQEGCNQHMELTGETFWVLDNEGTTFPTSMWYVRPDRMEPVPDSQYFLRGWIYSSPGGEQIPLELSQVVMEKLPDPLDPFRGTGPVGSISANIDQQHYATEYQRNLFYNNADPGGVIQVDKRLSDSEWDELTDRWRETHQGIARAGRVGVLENGASWMPSGSTNKDLEYGNLRLANRDELREAWRMHKSMLGTVEDVNRANAQTAEEVFESWMVTPRLERRKNTLNHKFLPLFGTTGQGVEFDYDDPTPGNREEDDLEMTSKSSAAQVLISAGFDPADVLEVVGLPDMAIAEKATQEPAVPPGWVLVPPGGGTAPEPATSGAKPAKPATPDEAEPAVTAREVVRLLAKKLDPASAVYQQAATDYPADSMAWMHDATWKGPISVPIGHIDPKVPWMDDPDPARVQKFVKRLQKGKKLKPVIVVKTPGKAKLLLVDGHHRYLADAELNQPVEAFIGTVATEHGDWETMHDQQFGRQKAKDTSNEALEYLRSQLRPYTARALPASSLNRGRL